MSNQYGLLVLITIIVGLISWISTSFKTGFVANSFQTYLKEDRPKFEIDKTQLPQYIACLCSVLLLSLMVGFFVTHEIAAMIWFSFLNLFFISYGAAYWMLLKEKKS